MPESPGMVLEVLLPVGRLFAFTMAGFLLFQVKALQRYLLRPAVWFFMNIVFPFYFIHTMPDRWALGAESGWEWVGIFFGLYLVFLAIQFFAAKLLINRAPLMHTKHPREFLVTFSMHNAGYIPIPIVAALAPAVVSLYLSFYIMAFVICFFTVAVWIIQGAADGQPFRFKPNGPMIGIALGLVIAVSGVYQGLPGWVQTPFRVVSDIALDGVMVVLGAVLATVPRSALRFKPEFGGYIIYKMIAFPLIVLGILALIPLRGLAPDVAAGIKLALVVQAAVPPATNIMVLTKAYGNEEQVLFAGGAIISSYLAALVLIPVFLILSRLVFGG